MKKNEMFELAFPGPVPEGAYAEPDLTVTFILNGKETKVKGFYDGEGIYKARFLPEETGELYWKTEGIVTTEGSEVCEDSDARGKVHAQDFHFEYADGTLFWPFGTTVYALPSQEDALVKTTLDTLKKSPFNKVRMSPFPKYYAYNENEPPYYPFLKKADGSWDTGRPDLQYWHRFEKIFSAIGNMEIQVDLILFHPYDSWGFSTMSEEEDRVYLENVIRRLAAYPFVWWSLANEYDLFEDKTDARWHRIEEYVHDNDPFHHLISCHNCFGLYDSARPDITHASIQSKNTTRVAEWRDKFKKPVVIDECGYEGDIPEFFGCLSAYEMTARVWRTVVTGGFCTHGETFLDSDDILWWAKGGVLKGKSPERIGFLKKICESLPGPIDPFPNHMMEASLPENRSRAEKAFPYLPKEQRAMIRGILAMEPEEARRMSDFEAQYQGHVGDDVFITFYDLRCSARDTLDLPENASYTITLIDTMKMTSKVIAEHASGKTVIELPGKEGMAAIARKE